MYHIMSSWNRDNYVLITVGTGGWFDPWPRLILPHQFRFTICTLYTPLTHVWVVCSINQVFKYNNYTSVQPYMEYLYTKSWATPFGKCPILPMVTTFCVWKVSRSNILYQFESNVKQNSEAVVSTCLFRQNYPIMWVSTNFVQECCQ